MLKEEDGTNLATGTGQRFKNGGRMKNPQQQGARAPICLSRFAVAAHFDPYMTVPEVAEYTRMSRQAVRTAILLKELPATKPGDRPTAQHRMRLSQVNLWMGREPEPKPDPSVRKTISDAKHYDPYLKAKEAALYVGLSAKRLSKVVRSGKIPVAPMSEGPKLRYLVRLSELNRWMKRTETKLFKL
jgi:excisionase family DNA binding protein